MRKIYSLLILLTLGFIATGNAQDILIKNGKVTNCGGVFYDSGGAAGDYKPNETYVFTICASDPKRDHISLGFDFLDIDPSDELCFFDGPTVNDSLLACASDYANIANSVIQTTADNPSGCLTVRFRSNSTVQGGGWKANIICIPSCQSIKAVVESSTPIISPRDTGWIDGCPGKTKVVLKGRGVYPQNNFAYTQSDALSKFEWNFGDGSPVQAGTDVTHVFDNPGGYVVRLQITDTLGCKNYNYIKQRVRMAPRPSFRLGDIPSQVCAGSEIKLNAKVNALDPKYQVSVKPNEAYFATGGVRSGRLFIPDNGTNEYKTSVVFSDFGPGQKLTNINDLLSIFVNMEHSWARDLDIKIVCPNKQQAILHKYDVATRRFNIIYIGKPNFSDDAVFVNDSTRNPPGTGLRYDWTPSGLKTWKNFFPNPGTWSLPAGAYKSDEALTKLVGCPLNGEWSLVVKDQFKRDNGWIFSWGIEFAKTLYPQLEKFTPVITDHRWVKNGAVITTSYENDLMVVRPKQAGVTAFSYTIKDNFGCSYDTTFKVTVLPRNSLACLSCDLDSKFNKLQDVSFCKGTSYVLPKSFIGNSNTTIPFENSVTTFLTPASASIASPYISSVPVSAVSPTTITTPLSQIDSVCFDIGTLTSQDLVVSLESPTGQQVLLFNKRGAGSLGNRSVCFSPSATQSITTATAPYTGTYQPEGGAAAWNQLVGSNTNGNWNLLVGLAAGSGQDTLKRWSVNFTTKSKLRYTWTPAAGLSCTDCLNPTAKPLATTTYNIAVFDSVTNCTHNDKITITLQDSLDAPALSLANLNINFITFSWTPVTGAIAYEISINNGPWIAPNGNLRHGITQLKSGDVINFQVRAIGNGTCGSKISSLTQTIPNCSATIGLGVNRRLEIDSIPCFGDFSPRVVFKYSNGIQPLTYIIDNITQLANQTFLDTIKAGRHKAILIDNVGCRDSIYFDLGHPTPLVVKAKADSIKCDGDLNGKIIIAASGGTPSYTYEDITNGTGRARNIPVFDSLDLGRYIILVTDSHGCTGVDTANIFAPLPLYVDTLMRQDVNCFGDKTGAGIADAQDGTLPYSWIWSNGKTTAIIDSLAKGTYYVTVTDKNNCKFNTSITIDENPKIDLVGVQDSAKCFGSATGTATVLASGGANNGFTAYNYLWNNNVTNQDNPLIFAGKYLVTVTDELGCSEKTTVTVLEPNELKIDTIITTNALCFSTPTGSASVQVSGGVGNYTYDWTPGNQATPSVNGLFAGNYSVSVSDANFCSTTKNLTIGSNNALQIDTILLLNPLKCTYGNDGQVAVNVSGGTGTYKYFWSTTPQQNTATVSNLTKGTYTVTVTDQNDCPAIKEITLVEPAAITVTIIAKEDVKCKSESTGTATAFVSGGTPSKTGNPYQYKWSDPLAQTTSNATNLPKGIYIVTVTDANGCVEPANVEILEPLTKIKASATQTKIGCLNQLTAQAQAKATGGTGQFAYFWSDQQTSALALGLGKGVMNVRIVDENGCQDSASVVINTRDSIQITLSSIMPSCNSLSDGSVNVESVVGGAGANLKANYLYQWNTSPAKTTSQISNLRGVNTYSVTATDVEGCFNSASIFVDEPAPMTMTPSVKPVSCFNGNDGAIEIVVTGSKPIISYKWSQNANTGVIKNEKATALYAGTYKVTITDNANCSVDTVLTVKEPTIIKIQNKQVANTKCIGDTLGSISTIVSGGIPGYTFAWNNGATTANLSSLPSGVYNLVVTDANNCVMPQTVNLKSPDALDGDISTIPVKCYSEQNGVIKINAFGGTPPYLYSTNGQNFNGINQVIGLKAGKYDVFIQDANKCAWSSKIEISQPPKFTLEAMPDVTINLGDSVQLFANVLNSRGKVDIVWKAPYENTISCTKCPTPMTKTINTITYGVSAVDSAGCRATDSVKVTVMKPRYIYVPTGFSPNKDQVNDRLTVRGKDGTKITVFRVYDRWGELLYEAQNFKINDASFGWDGTFKSEPMVSGLYVWYIEAEYIDGAKETLKGGTTLIR